MVQLGVGKGVRKGTLTFNPWTCPITFSMDSEILNIWFSLWTWLFCSTLTSYLMLSSSVDNLYAAKLILAVSCHCSPSGTTTLGCSSTSSPSSSSSASLSSTCSSEWWWKTSTSAASTRRLRRPGAGKKNGCAAWRKNAGVRRCICLVGRLFNLSEALPAVV